MPAAFAALPRVVGVGAGASGFLGERLRRRERPLVERLESGVGGAGGATEALVLGGDFGRAGGGVGLGLVAVRLRGGATSFSTSVAARLPLLLVCARRGGLALAM